MTDKLVLDHDLVWELTFLKPGTNGGSELDNYTFIEAEFDRTTRWSVMYRVVIEDTEGNFWAGYLEEPATEMVSGDYNEPVAFKRVFPHEKTITVYE